MRFISGVVVGALLIVAAAYAHDASLDRAADHPGRPMVNWDVAAEAFRQVEDWIRQQFDWIGRQLPRPGSRTE